MWNAANGHELLTLEGHTAPVLRVAFSPDLQPTALVHEAWLKLAGQKNPRFESRAHFFRRKRALHHGGGQERVDIQDVDPAATAKDDELP